MSTPPSFALRDYFAERAKRLEDLPKRAKELADKLHAAGITSVHAEYSGSGDSGQIDGISHKPDTAVMGGELESEIQDLFYDVLESRYPGWEINDGSAGDFNWDVVNNKIGHEHTRYYTESDSEMHEGLDK